MTTMSEQQTDYLTHAHNTFTNLSPAFAGDSNYWQLGHSFETIIDYLALNPADAAGFGEIANDRYQNSSETVCWYDDNGWWGIAALKASQHPELFPTHYSDFQEYTNACWKRMDDNAPKVWEAGKADFPNLKPRFDGGVWNAYWTSVVVPGKCSNLTPCVPRFSTDALCDGSQGG